MSTDFLRVNKIMTDTYGHPRLITFIYRVANQYVPSMLATDDFVGHSWISVYDRLTDVWSKMLRGDLFISSLDDPPQFTPLKFYKGHVDAPPPKLSEFFAEMMVEAPDEIKVPSTEGWEDLV